MLFTDPKFIFFFLPLTLLLHAMAVQANRGAEYSVGARTGFFLSTLVFYGSGEPWWLVPFLASISFDFLWGNLIHTSQTDSRRKFFLWLSVAQNLGLLIFFKAKFTSLAFPAGISFYTFESLSFVIDVYRREIVPPKAASEFFAFIGMYPRFIAGPIVRYKAMAEQFRSYPGMQIEKGLCYFAFGLFLKLSFADTFAQFVGCAFEVPSASAVGSWFGLFCYTMQLYFDFWGYSVMAIGLGKCFGFTFPINFRHPYHATSFRDLWRRWHITLSRWLRDYLYVPLGGNRHGYRRTQFNLMLTMMLGGLWHGLNWTFAAWGAWHGLLLCLERSFPQPVLSTSVRKPLVFFAFMVGLVFFRAQSMGDAGRVFWQLIGGGHAVFDPRVLFAHPAVFPMVIVGSLFCLFAERLSDWSWIREFETRPTGWVERAATASLLAFAINIDATASSIPFLYFQF